MCLLVLSVVKVDGEEDEGQDDSDSGKGGDAKKRDRVHTNSPHLEDPRGNRLVTSWP